MTSHKIFVEVVDAGGFSAAAKLLHKSPSAISKQISTLEKKIGVQLLVRTTRTLELTEAGELFYQRSKEIVQRMEDTRVELLEFKSSPSGRITLTWPNGLSYSSVSAALGSFAEQNPHIKLDVRASTEVVNLISEKIDFAFRVSELSDSNLVAIKLGNLRRMFCASPNLISRYGMPDSIDALFDMPHLIPSYINFSHLSRGLLSSLKDFNLNKYHAVNDIASLYNLTKEGVGAAALFHHVVEKDLQDGTLIDLTESVPLPPVPLYLVYPKLEFQPKKNRVFIDHFKDYYRI